MGRPFDHDFIFPWNLACVSFDHDGFLAWDSFSQLWFVDVDEFNPIFLIFHLAKSGQPMYGPDLDNKVGLLGACIRSSLGYINEYEFGLYEVQS
jgi:hypothetical protein